MFLGISGRQDLNLRPLVPNQVLYQAEPLPVNKSAPESRTPNLLIRSQTLYPIELRAHMVPRAGSNPHGGHPPQDFKSCASACSATPACHIENWSGRRDSNPRPQPWQGCILPLNYFRKTCMSYFIKSAGEGSRTPRQRRQILSLVRLPIPPHPHINLFKKNGATDGNRTHECRSHNPVR